ncbi:hypothetical protein MPTA7396_0900 [Mycoplasmoides pneumoniae]|uniref:Uncharacterized protein n=3 Tax=Mycoplasmoides pneumoniae TaxID=2104 RepID=A0AAV5N6K4_MYCPM|nr:hypothetical protein [Mycoplasmoides pneumoniae]ALA30934.1 hypothetical protein B434_02005 [Mycoplasmoides pneumoniae 19294]ALA31370.1 hypothetical protein F536_00485 [Mycoplasmoides pneumoniae 39443]ALA35603.1 hypothetical protein F539_00480 [Mycoplasmoides pneumoniae FH]ALA36309.1 hypothetical protein F538_00485 [Mycoplasmoides pneumoniae M1139]ALA37022.1 hypothetical protein RF41_00480 [Mycoplasmoides pneumoniae]
MEKETKKDLLSEVKNSFHSSNKNIKSEIILKNTSENNIYLRSDARRLLPRIPYNTKSALLFTLLFAFLSGLSYGLASLCINFSFTSPQIFIVLIY